MNHKCTKCGAAYQDEDVEDYLCEPCIAERKAIAAKVDAERAGIPRVQPKSDLQMLEEGQKVNFGGRSFYIAK